ncbi:hypothetical protein B0H34DRAFT_718183, partial [Crassisporium funariophilum]
MCRTQDLPSCCESSIRRLGACTVEPSYCKSVRWKLIRCIGACTLGCNLRDILPPWCNSSHRTSICRLGTCV